MSGREVCVSNKERQMLTKGDSNKDIKCKKRLAEETLLETDITKQCSQICSRSDKVHPLCSNCGRKINDTGPKKGKQKDRISDQELSTEQSKQLQHNITEYAHMVKHRSSTTHEPNIISSTSQQENKKRKKNTFVQRIQNRNNGVGTNNKSNIYAPQATALQQHSLLKCIEEYQKSIKYF